MKMIFQIIISLILVSTSYSQNLSELFIDYLPLEMVSDEKKLKMISLQLESAAKIHPDLIYYKIIQLNGLYQDFYGIQAKKDFSKINKYYLDKRTKWALNQITELSKMEIDSKTRDTGVDFYSTLINQQNIESNYLHSKVGVDQNKLHFYAYKYYLQDVNLSYSETADYQKIRTEFENNKRSEINNFFENVTKDEIKNHLDQIEDLKNYWFIFQDTGAYIEMIVAADYFDFSIPWFKQPDEMPLFSFEIGAVFSLNQLLKLHLPINNSVKDVIQKNELSSSHLTSFSATAKYIFKDNLSYFSYITFKGKFAFELNKTSYQNNFDQLISRKYSTDNADYREEILLYVNDFENKSFYLTQLEIASPIYTFKNFLIFELGYSVGVLVSEYSMNYDYTLLIREFPYDAFPRLHYDNGSQDFSKTEKTFIHYPLLNTKFIFEPIEINFEVSTNLMNASFGFRW